MMSVKEADRWHIILQTDSKVLNKQRASEPLGLAFRKAKRIQKRYLSKEDEGLILRYIRKISANQIQPEIKETVIKIFRRKEYSGFGPRFVIAENREAK